MKRTLIALTAALLSTTLGTAAFAQTQQAAQALFDDGKWQEATTAALALNNATGYALAAESTPPPARAWSPTVRRRRCSPRRRTTPRKPLPWMPTTPKVTSSWPAPRAAWRSSWGFSRAWAWPGT